MSLVNTMRLTARHRCLGTTSPEGYKDGRYRLLHEVQDGEGDRQPPANSVEEREAGNNRYLPGLRDEDLQDREGSLTEISFGPGLASAGTRGR